MYFTRSLSSIAVSSLLATTALGSTIQLPRQAAANVVAREEANVRREAMPEGIRRRASQCLSDMKKKRELVARTAYNIGIGEAAFGKNDDTIDTAGLASCFGVAVVGTWMAGTDGDFDRAMSHTYADSAEDETVLEAFATLVGNVHTAIQGGLSIDRTVMVATDPAAYKLEDGWTQAEIDMYNKEYADYVGTLTQLTGRAPEEKKHHYDEAWRLSIKSDKAIECGPEGGSNQC
ncbi:hypothetical protein F5B22DRAFT_653255 [Xylaria bambusicola]|uniref:uncharacterized protein n=1 Tax=Xylaria bambusicola TaxID=326684 RepID=UPI002007477B|nr:uncharacterized protein F5B22DRAFT_653255 [Xylaria bambusicola]KAI0528201.1 hypothetical protein F5B22DRAFT_653255 [Xylaria bambusicola]